MFQTVRDMLHDWRSYRLGELHWACPWLPAILLVEMEELPVLAERVCTDFDYRMEPIAVFRLLGPLGFLRELEVQCGRWIG